MNKPDHIAQDDWDALEEAEREALVEDEEQEESVDGQGDNDAGGVDDSGEEAQGDSEPAPDASKDDTEAGGEDGEGADKDAGDDVKDSEDGEKGEGGEDDTSGQRYQGQEQPQPLLRAGVPDDAEQKLEQIATTRDELDTKFDDGELTTSEYRKQVRDLDRQENAIEQAQFKAELAAEMDQQQRANAWMSDVQGFLVQNPQYQAKMDGDDQVNPLYDLLDTQVKRIARTDEGQAMTGQEILAKAHDRIAAFLPGQQDQSDSEDKPAGKKAKTPKPDLPPNLGKVPAAEATETDSGGKWAKYDRLMESDPQALEEELAKLTDEQRDEYLSSQ